jgi:hypothetical protein
MQFREISQEIGLTTTADGRGIVCFDPDNDGDLDLYFANQGQAPNFYRNETSGGHWLMVQLIAHPQAQMNRDAIGARVTVATERGTQIRERDGGNGYCGQSDPRLHFGLGEANVIRFVEVRWPGGTYQVVENPPVDRLLEVRQDPGSASTTSLVHVATPTPLRQAPAPASPTAALSGTELASRLEALESEMRIALKAYAPGASYRALCASHKLHDRSIEFFDSLVRRRPNDARARIELALAYVDKIPTCGGLAAIVSKGTLARRSLDQLDRVFADDGDSWRVRYCRGMNHLHWPRALRHSDDAAADFARCIELQNGDESEASKPYFERTYVGLGDALAKDGKIEAARAAWRKGFAIFPGSKELAERLRDRTDGELLDLIEERRSLENPIDTDLSFLDP